MMDIIVKVEKPSYELIKNGGIMEYIKEILKDSDYEIGQVQVEEFVKDKPMVVDDEDGITFTCPSCYADNSKWIDWSMLQRKPKRAKRCQECGQKLEWE